MDIIFHIIHRQIAVHGFLKKNKKGRRRHFNGCLEGIISINERMPHSPYQNNVSVKSLRLRGE